MFGAENSNTIEEYKKESKKPPLLCHPQTILFQILMNFPLTLLLLLFICGCLKLIILD
jgi:hypothetical protein